MCEETISNAIITLSDGSKRFPGLSNEVQSMESILFISAVKASGKRCHIPIAVDHAFMCSCTSMPAACNAL